MKSYSRPYNDADSSNDADSDDDRDHDEAPPNPTAAWYRGTRTATGGFVCTFTPGERVQEPEHGQTIAVAPTQQTMSREEFFSFAHATAAQFARTPTQELAQRCTRVVASGHPRSMMSSDEEHARATIAAGIRESLFYVLPDGTRARRGF